MILSVIPKTTTADVRDDRTEKAFCRFCDGEFCMDNSTAERISIMENNGRIPGIISLRFSRIPVII